MKVLLTTLSAKYIHNSLALNALYAASGAGKQDIEVMEFSINNDDDFIYGELLRGGYEVICFSCYIWNIERIIPLAGWIKEAKPGTKVVLGGPEATNRAQELMETYPFLDLIVCGEGEGTFGSLVNSGFSNPSKIPGLFYRQDGQVYQTEPALPMNLSVLPFPYEECDLETDKILYYESSRGCPFSCSYCLSALEKKIRALPVERVCQDLDRFLLHRVKQVKFVDRTFNYDRRRALELFRYLMEKDNGFTNFHFEICGELLDFPTLDLLKDARPGLFQFEIGVQTTNEDTLEAIRRTGDFEMLAGAVRTILASGNIHVHLDLIAGLPLEGYNAFIRSFDQVYGLMAHQLQLGFLKLLPGTPLFEEKVRYGYRYRTTAPYEVLSNRCMTPEDLVSLKDVERVLDLYYNRGGFRESLAWAIECKGEGAFAFYHDFASFYVREGFHKRPHKKEDLYRIFWQYGQEADHTLPGFGQGILERLKEDMKRTLNSEAIRKFEKEGWTPVG